VRSGLKISFVKSDPKHAHPHRLLKFSAQQQTHTGGNILSM